MAELAVFPSVSSTQAALGTRGPDTQRQAIGFNPCGVVEPVGFQVVRK